MSSLNRKSSVMTLDKKRAKYESQLQELEAVKKSLTQKIGKHFESFEKLDENDPKLGQKKKDLKDKIKRATQELQNQALDEKIHHMQSKLDDLDENQMTFTAHPNVSRNRICNDDENIEVVRQRTPKFYTMNPDDSDGEPFRYVSHPNIELLRDPDLARRAAPRKSYLAHPNISLSRITFGATPGYGVERRSTTAVSNHVPKFTKSNASCDCKRSSMYERNKLMKGEVKQDVIPTCNSYNLCPVCSNETDEELLQNTVKLSASGISKKPTCISIDNCDKCANIARLKRTKSLSNAFKKSCQSLDICEGCASCASAKKSKSLLNNYNHSCQSIDLCNDCVNFAKEAVMKSCQSMDVCKECLNFARDATKMSTIMKPSHQPVGASSDSMADGDTAKRSCISMDVCDDCLTCAKEAVITSCQSLDVCKECVNYARDLVKPSKPVITFDQSCQSMDICSDCSKSTLNKSCQSVDEGDETVQPAPTEQSCQSLDICEYCIESNRGATKQSGQSLDFCDESKISARMAAKKSKSLINTLNRTCQSLDVCNECNKSLLTAAKKSRSLINTLNRSCQSFDVCDECNKKSGKVPSSSQSLNVCSRCSSNNSRALKSSKSTVRLVEPSCTSFNLCDDCAQKLPRTSSMKQNLSKNIKRNHFASEESSCDSTNLCSECNTPRSQQKVPIRLTKFNFEKASSDELLQSCRSIEVCDECKKIYAVPSKSSRLNPDEVRGSCISLDCSKCHVKDSLRSHTNCIKSVCLPYFYNETPVPCAKAKGSVTKLSPSVNMKKSLSHVWLNGDLQSRASSIVAKKSSIGKPAVNHREYEARMNALAPWSQRRPIGLKRSQNNVWLLEEDPESPKSSKLSKVSSRREIGSNESQFQIKGASCQLEISSNSDEKVFKTPISKQSLQRGPSMQQLLEEDETCDSFDACSECCNKRNTYQARFERGETIVIQQAEVTIRPISKIQQKLSKTLSKQSLQSKYSKQSRPSTGALPTNSLSRNSNNSTEIEGQECQSLANCERCLKESNRRKSQQCQSISDCERCMKESVQRKSTGSALSKSRLATSNTPNKAPKLPPRGTFTKTSNLSRPSQLALPKVPKRCPVSYQSSSDLTINQPERILKVNNVSSGLKMRPVTTLQSLLKRSSSIRVIRGEVVKHNKIIDSLYEEIQQKSGSADQNELTKLQSKLESEKEILREAVQKAMLEQRRNKGEKFDPLPVNIKEEY